VGEDETVRGIGKKEGGIKQERERERERESEYEASTIKMLFCFI